MLNDVILSLLIIFPIVSGLIILLTPNSAKKSIKISALYCSFIVLIFSLFLFANFEPISGFQFVTNIPWNTEFGISYLIGVDGISILLVLLSTLFTPFAILSSWNTVNEKEKAFYASIMMLEGFLIGSAVSLDAFLFYTFWELMLLPTFLMIGVWGESKKLAIVSKFFVYTMIGSLGMLFSLLYIYYNHFKQFGYYSFALADLYKTEIPVEHASILFFLFLIAFAIKAPLFPFHSWLPDTYTDAPASTTLILSAVMAKLGVYGMIRFVIPLFPSTFAQYSNLLMTLAVIGTVYGGLIALVQKDMKRLIAYSSMSHLGYIVLGVFALNVQALQGSIFQMLNHALSTGALFLLVGFLEERIKTREIDKTGGLMKVLTPFGVLFMLAMFSSIGLPGLNGFVGEFLIFLGVFGTSPIFSAIATTSVIVGASYMLWMFQRVMFGKLNEDLKFSFKALRQNEILALIPISALIIFLGIFPQPVLGKIEPTVAKYIEFINNKKSSNEISALVDK